MTEYHRHREEALVSLLETSSESGSQEMNADARLHVADIDWRHSISMRHVIADIRRHYVIFNRMLLDNVNDIENPRKIS